MIKDDSERYYWEGSGSLGKINGYRMSWELMRGIRWNQNK